MQITYGFLREAMRKGLRNGNGGVWVGLSVHFTRHRCVMRGFINANIVEKLLAIVEMIYETQHQEFSNGALRRHLKF